MRLDADGKAHVPFRYWQVVQRVVIKPVKQRLRLRRLFLILLRWV